MQSVVLCCAAALIAGPHALGAQAPFSFLAAEWGPENGGLRMAISSATPATDRARQPEFYIAIENVGDRDVVLNLGSMLSNGKVMFPKAVRLLLTDPQGTTRELQYFDKRYAAVAGRVDDYIVALRAGSVYAMRVSLDHYSSSTTNESRLELARGRYRIAARFDGDGARSLNNDSLGIGLLNFWKGTLHSNSHVFEIRSTLGAWQAGPRGAIAAESRVMRGCRGRKS